MGKSRLRDMSVAILDPAERQILGDKAEHIGDLTRTAAIGDGANLIDHYRTLEDAVLDLSNRLPAGCEDYDARKLFEFLVALRRAVYADASAQVLLPVTQLHDTARRLGRRLAHAELEQPEPAARFILTSLSGVRGETVARLLGVSTKTLSNWRAGRPVRKQHDRVVLVAQLVSYLRPGMTAAGVATWFEIPREQLKGDTPLVLLDRDVTLARARLVPLARGGRGQLAA